MAQTSNWRPPARDRSCRSRVQHGAASPAIDDRLAREDVVEPPADVALPHVPPRRPPGEQSVVVGIERAADVDQAAADDAARSARAPRAAGRSPAACALSDARRMSVRATFMSPQSTSALARCAGTTRRRRPSPRGTASWREVLAAVRHVDRRDRQAAAVVDGDDAVLVVEAGWAKAGRSGANVLLTCRPTPE